MAESKSRTITLTDRAPVRIQDADWPRLAWGDGDSGTGRDVMRDQVARAQGELDIYTLVARRHADGRILVYAILDAATAWTGTEERREGEILPSGVDVPAALRRVGERCGLPDSVIRGAIASLEPEQL